MKSLKNLFFFVSGIVTLAGCQVSSGSHVNENDLNPNGSSELSILMRTMHANAEGLKNAILQDSAFGNFPEALLTIHTAKPTDDHTKKPSFTAYASSYLFALKETYSSDINKKVENYNNTINACLACHSDHCPGPVPKIKKLMIENPL